jgi:hypothetical protein
LGSSAGGKPIFRANAIKQASQSGRCTQTSKRLSRILDFAPIGRSAHTLHALSSTMSIALPLHLDPPDTLPQHWGSNKNVDIAGSAEQGGG